MESLADLRLEIIKILDSINEAMQKEGFRFRSTTSILEKEIIVSRMKELNDLNNYYDKIIVPLNTRIQIEELYLHRQHKETNAKLIRLHCTLETKVNLWKQKKSLIIRETIKTTM